MSFNLRPVPETTAGEERRPIIHQNGGGTYAPEGPDMELHPPNYNTMAETTPDPEDGYRGPQGKEWAGPRPLQPQRQHAAGNPSQDTESCLSYLKLWFLMWSCCLLGVLTALLGIIILAGAVSLLKHLPPNTCTSAECYKAAGDILSSLKDSVSPCDDFAEFACGGWQRKHPLPESKFRWGTLDNLDEQTLLDVQGLLEEGSKKGEPHTIKVTKTLYLACANNSQWEKVGLTPLLALLEREGGLPMIELDWAAPQFEVMSTLARLRRTLANQYLVSVTVEPDSRNTSSNAIHLSQGMLPMLREYFTPDTPLSRYHKAARITLMRQTGEFLLMSQQKERNATLLNNLYKDVDDLWAFSVKVAEITEPVMSLSPWELYNPMTVDQLQALTDAANTTFKVDWLRFLNEIFNGTEIHLTGRQKLVVDRPAYLARLVGLLQDTPARTLANYLLFPLVMAMGEEVHGGVLAHPPSGAATWTLGRRSTRTWYDCAKKVRSLLPFGVGALYARSHLAASTQGLARDVVDDVSAAFRDMLMKATWMDSITLQEALLKLKEMRHLVAFPKFTFVDALLEEYHKGIPDVRTNDHFGNILTLTAWHCRKSLLSLNSVQGRDDWPRGPVEPNAFYSFLTNAIVIPLAVLQPPIFIPENITAVNYGSLGSIIGHEITHGFDNKGRMRDAHGNLNHWWSNTTLHQYLNRTQCIVEQYSSYDAASLLPPHLRQGKHLLINGVRTLGENIADNIGLNAAWEAYRKRAEKEGPGRSLSLPGLERFTDDQLFFISFAKFWCTNLTPYALRYVLRADVHAPEHFRVLGALRNSQAFAKAFNCPVGSPMNPKKKCVLW